MWHFKKTPISVSPRLSRTLDEGHSEIEIGDAVELHFEILDFYCSCALLHCESDLGDGMVGQLSGMDTSSLQGQRSEPSEFRCAWPSTRQKWRSLGPEKKKAYINAAQCIGSQLSRSPV